MDLALVHGEIHPFEDLDVTCTRVKALDLEEGGVLAHIPMLFPLSP
jgi:hypothetical protein